MGIKQKDVKIVWREVSKQDIVSHFVKGYEAKILSYESFFDNEKSKFLLKLIIDDSQSTGGKS